MLEEGFKSTSEIPANNVSAHGAQANVTAEIDIYKPLWLRESEAQMLAESRKRILGPATPRDCEPSDLVTALATISGKWKLRIICLLLVSTPWGEEIHPDAAAVVSSGRSTHESEEGPLATLTGSSS